MLLGFISLLLTITQAPISRICIPAKMGDIMLPCQKGYDSKPNDGGQRKLLWDGEEALWRRVLVGTNSDYCSNYDGKVSLISQSGIHQLHILVFVLAVFHVLYSVLTMALAQAKVAFFRQFFGSVTKVDYLTMRHGFVNAHLSPNSNFNFHKYIKRSLEDDFKVVVGISPSLWSIAIMILFLDVYGWYTLLWISFVPLIVLLLVGTKLELVIMDMAHQIQERTAVVKGAPVIEPSNKYFWFNRPEWILFLVHLTLFENAFQMAHFLWTWYSFGLRSCFHENVSLTIVKVVIGVALQVLCSYITFPLYALVTQMGSHMKKAIFEEQTAKALKKWREAARERKKLRAAGIDAPSGYMSGENTPSRGSSPIHLLHKYKSSSADVESMASSPRFYQSDNDVSGMEAPTFSKHGDPDPRRPAAPKARAEVGGFTFASP